jgi:hypothetical protein
LVNPLGARRKPGEKRDSRFWAVGSTSHWLKIEESWLLTGQSIRRVLRARRGEERLQGLEALIWIFHWLMNAESWVLIGQSILGKRREPGEKRLQGLEALSCGLHDRHLRVKI